MIRPDPVAPVDGARKLWASEVSVRFAYPYLDEYERRWGREALERFLAGWGTTARELRADETQWVALAFLEALCEEIVEKAGSDEIVARCARLAVTRKYIGAIYPLLRLLGSPGKAYEGLEKLSETVNKVNRVELEQRGRGSARLVYWPGAVAETSAHVCAARRAQLAAIPSVWGLPDARLTEVDCIHDGGEACRYDLQWQRRTFAIGGLVGALAGATTLVLHGWFFGGALLPFALLAALLVIGGMLLDSSRAHRETRRFAREQNQALSSLLASADANFERVVAEMKRRHEAEDQATDLRQQLDQSQKLETVGRLAGGVAHDFNNLLTVINGYAELAVDRLPADDPLEADLRKIREAGESAANLTRQLLAFSRKQVMAPQLLDLNVAVQSLHGMLRRLIGEDIELQIELAPTSWKVSADPVQIEQVLLNLAVNARDAMPRGGELRIATSNVELDASFAAAHADMAAGPHVLITVSDNGMGMAPEVRERLFEPFFTTKEQGRGTGLGLATVYGIIKQSGGNIWVESEQGRGTTFSIYLPRAEGEAKAVAISGDHGASPKTGSETILVVEDDETVRRLTERILVGAGYEPIVASNGDEALQEVERSGRTIDLLLTDVVMPKMGGRRLAERLTSSCSTLRVLYMSGYTDDAIARQELDAGIHLISKPFSAPQLLEKVRTVLDRGRPHGQTP